MSELIQVFIVEDEAITRATLQDGLEEMGIQVVGYADEAKMALEKIPKSDTNLIILDINLIGEEDGIWLGEKLKEEGRLPFIYLTAYGDEKTVQLAVKTNPHGYLLKPFESIDVYAAISVATENFSRNRSAETDNLNLEEPKKEALPNQEYLFIKDDHLFVKLKKSDIGYIKSDNNYLDIYLHDHRHLVRSKLSEFMKVLPQHQFLQVHRSYAINIHMVQSFGASFVNV